MAVSNLTSPRVSGNRTPDAVREECRRLRLEERLTVNEIAALIGVSKSTAWLIAGDIKLETDELSARRSAAAQKFLAPINRAKAVCYGADSSYYEIIKSRVTTTDQKGAIAEAATIFRLKVWGYVPHLPMCAGGKSDVVVFVPDTQRLLRIQVKCARRGKNGMPFASLCSRAGGRIDVRYSDDAFDFFVGYDLRSDVCYVFTTAETANRSRISMTTANAERWDKLLVP